MKRFSHIIGALALCAPVAAPVWAGEYAILGNGFRLHADRHEVAGDVVKLYSGAGVVEMPAASVNGFEQEEVAPAPPAVSPIEPAPVAPAASAKATEAQPVNPKQIAGKAAKKFALPAGFVEGVMKAESGFHPNALSPKGAIGLMQLMPGTAAQLGVDPKDPNQNAEGGAQYLRTLLAKYESDPNQVLLALAAYNAGPGAVEKYHGVPPYAETRQYILRVLKNWESSKQ